jgi:hypothetical protein
MVAVKIFDRSIYTYPPDWELHPFWATARNAVIEQLVTVMYLYKDVPNVEFLMNAMDHPLHCNASLPSLQYSIVNLTSPSSGEAMDMDPDHLVCDDNGRRAAGCLGYSKGFAVPTYEAWGFGMPAEHLLRFTACIHSRTMVSAGVKPTKMLPQCGSLPRREVLFWRGTCTGGMRGWSKHLSGRHHAKVTEAGARYWYMSKALLNKRLQVALMGSLYPWMDTRTVRHMRCDY